MEEEWQCGGGPLYPTNLLSTDPEHPAAKS